MAGFPGVFRRFLPSPEQAGETPSPPHADDPSLPLLVAYGLGGALRLYRDHLEIQHFGFAHMLVEFVSFHTPRLSTRIRLSEITAIEVVRPVVMPDYLVVSYAGAPTPHGGYLHRAFASNALLMSYLENRDFFVIFDRIARADERRDPVDIVV